jgi:hypothetical protein
MKLKHQDCSAMFSELPFCEHCGDAHSHYGAEVNDGSTYWCLECAAALSLLTPKEYSYLKQMEVKLTKEFFDKKAKSS